MYFLKCHIRSELPTRTFCFVAATQIPSGEQLLFLTRILAITITMLIAFRESSHGVAMHCSNNICTASIKSP